jgi:hypothetical protein
MKFLKREMKKEAGMGDEMGMYLKMVNETLGSYA